MVKVIDCGLFVGADGGFGAVGGVAPPPGGVGPVGSAGAAGCPCDGGVPAGESVPALGRLCGPSEMSVGATVVSTVSERMLSARSTASVTGLSVCNPGTGVWLITASPRARIAARASGVDA